MVSYVDELKIGSWCIEVLSEMEVKALPIPPLDCRTLEIQIINCLGAGDLPAIFGLIRNSSNLEKFVIGGFGCGYMYMETVEFIDLDPTQDETELELMKYLLKNCGSLQKATIHGLGSYNDEEVEEITEKLLSFPIASPHVVVRGPLMLPLFGETGLLIGENVRM